MQEYRSSEFPLYALVLVVLMGAGCVDGTLSMDDDDAGDDDAGDDDASGDDDAGDDDAGDDDTAGDDDSIPATPGIQFTVPSGDLAGTYSYTADASCEISEGFPTVAAAEDAGWDAWLGFEFASEPSPSAHVENFVLTWYSPWPWVEADGSAECFVDTIDGWPAVTATFECLGVNPHGGGMWDPHDIVEGTVRCP